MLLHFHTNHLDFNMLDFSLIFFHHKYCFPPRLCVCVCAWMCIWMEVFYVYVCKWVLCASVSCPWHLHVNLTVLFLRKSKDECLRRGWGWGGWGWGVQRQNELMLNIPYWFYYNSFLILSLFNFISLRLVGMEMRSLLLFFSSFFLPV